MSLDLFSPLVGLAEEELHPKFKLLQQEPMLTRERGIVAGWADGFVDRDNKIVHEFQTTFHSAFWEIYLHALFKEAGFDIDFSRNRPDFIINKPTPFYVEAVVSEIKNGGSGEDLRTPADQFTMLEPFDCHDKFSEIVNEAITRHSNSILSKHKKLSEYLKCEWVDESAPFVLAFGSYDQINYGREYHHSLVALLYGMYFDPVENKYSKVASIRKPGTSAEIPVGLFNGGELDGISAIIFSCTTTLGKLTSLALSASPPEQNYNFVLNIRHNTEEPWYLAHIVSQDVPEELSDGLFVFHNPYAKNPIASDVFSRTNAVQVYKDGNGVKFEGGTLPIVSRFNYPKMLMPEPYRTQLIAETLQKFNGAS